jgi:hypothetical protein
VGIVKGGNMILILKIIAWAKVNLASVLGALQLVIKALKELLTAIVNLVSIVLPTTGAQKAVLVIRAALEWLDNQIEKLKVQLIPAIS